MSGINFEFKKFTTMKTLLIFSLIILILPFSNAQNIKKQNYRTMSFGEGGQIKMLYDRRSRPQSLFLNGKIYLVFNGGAEKGSQNTEPKILTYDPIAKEFSEEVTLGPAKKDQHYCPIIWTDNYKFLHILYGCHSSSGTHLISNKTGAIGTSLNDWNVGPQIRHSLSYPTVYNIYDNKKLIYFRTGEHRSSWSYLISADEGKTWSGPENDVTDLNMGGETKEENNRAGLTEMASYQTCLPSKDGKFLHVAFCYYDDNKKSIPEKFYNPRYQTKKNLDFKFNLYYVKINLQTNEVENFAGETVKTPIDLDNANAKCKIWDTDWKGTGVPPDIIIDENDNPAFLHVLSEDTPEEFNYYYVRYNKNKWEKTVITPSNHYWNSGYLKIDVNGILYAYLIVGHNLSVAHNEKKESMNAYGGGNIEEWRSFDKGKTWEIISDLTPRNNEFAGWKFNNIQPIKGPKGNAIEGMLLFYGWKNGEAREAKAFLLQKK